MSSTVNPWSVTWPTPRARPTQRSLPVPPVMPWVSRGSRRATAPASGVRGTRAPPKEAQPWPTRVLATASTLPGPAGGTRISSRQGAVPSLVQMSPCAVWQ